jgi:hypothetical protein
LKLRSTKTRYFFEISKSQETEIRKHVVFKYHQQYKSALSYTTEELESMDGGKGRRGEGRVEERRGGEGRREGRGGRG